jgi:hypothetical protein
MIVPDNTIVVIPLKEDPGYEPFDMSELGSFLKSARSLKKRDWFSKDFYKCLPLAIGNTQGFIISVPFEFDVFWNGGSNPEDLFFRLYEDEKKFKNRSHIGIESHFGYGIITINLPVILKTPSQVNLMTIAPPNFPTPGLSPLTGVVEADNLRYTFTFNLKVDIANTWIKVLANSPLIGILPIPRYFCDQFSLVDGYDVLDEREIEEEREIVNENSKVDYFLRSNRYKKWWDGCYFDGTDIKGNVFKDHQMPN